MGHLILFDVWHHLKYPGTALKEFARVLAPGGRIIVFDPAMGLIGRLFSATFTMSHWDWKMKLNGMRRTVLRDSTPNIMQPREMQAACSEMRDSKTSCGCGELLRSRFLWPGVCGERRVPWAAVVSGRTVASLWSDRLSIIQVPKLASRMLVVLEQKTPQERKHT